MPRTNTVNAFETVTTEPVDASDTVIEVDTTDGIPEVPFYLALRPRDNENREYIRVESVSGNELNTDTTSNRYLPGSAADENQSHPVGTPVKIVVASQLFEDIWDEIDNLNLEGPVNEHEEEDDPHPQYLDESDADARYVKRQLHVERDDKDADDIFRTVKQIRDDGTVYSESVLSPEGEGPEYPERTVTWYEDDGTTVRDTIVYDLTYDEDGDLISEEVQA